MPPCGTCYPGIHPLNQTAIRLWGMVKGQWIPSFGGEHGINLVAVDVAMRLHGVHEDDQLHVAQQLLQMGDVIVAEVRRAQESKRAAVAK